MPRYIMNRGYLETMADLFSRQDISLSKYPVTRTAGKQAKTNPTQWKISAGTVSIFQLLAGPHLLSLMLLSSIPKHFMACSKVTEHSDGSDPSCRLASRV